MGLEYARSYIHENKFIEYFGIEGSVLNKIDRRAKHFLRHLLGVRVLKFELNLD